MYLDRDGMMWFTDAEYGASRLEPNENWRNFGIYNGEEEVYPGWESPVSMPWWQLTPNAGAWSEAPNQVYHDTDGNFWLRGANYVARSLGSNLSQWHFWEPGQNGLPWAIDSIGEDSLGNIWIGNEYALYRLDEDNWIDTPIGIPQFAPIRLEQGDDGELYAVRVATVYHVAGDTITQLYSTPDEFGHIHDLEVDGAVTDFDRAILCLALGSIDGDENFLSSCDLNHDNAIDQLDQQLFSAIHMDACPSDIVASNTFLPPGDGLVDAADLAFLLGAWGNSPSCADVVTNRAFAPPPDGRVDGADLAFMLGAWGACE